MMKQVSWSIFCFQQMLVTVSEQCDQKVMALREEEKQGEVSLAYVLV